MTELILPSRRGFLKGLVGVVAAPAIVHVTSLMPIHAWDLGVEDATAITVMRGNTLLTIHQITREAVRLFRNSNSYLRQIDEQYAEIYSNRFAMSDPLKVRIPE